MTLPAQAFPRSPQRDFASRLVEAVAADDRFAGLLAGGSAIAGSTDEYSDLDLILVVRDDAYADVLAHRRRFAETLGHLLYAFTGEHVGEPRLLICLFGEPVLHVDLKFVTARDLESRVEDPVVLWDRDGDVAVCLADGSARWPNRDPEWFEERVWIWLHYAATKIGRGELFEAIDALAFIRSQVLGPLAARRRGADQRGVRRLETVAPDLVPSFAATLGGHSREACAAALRQAVQLYTDLRKDRPPANRRFESEAEVLSYLESVINGALDTRDRD